MNKYLYHYTGLDTLFAILHWYKANKTSNCIQLKASCIYNMNDPKEMYVGYDVVKKCLSSYEVDNKVPLGLRLSEVYCNKDSEEECKEKYILKERFVDSYTDVPYVVCFSKKRDYLPMWSLYGKGGNGVCLIFDYSKIIDFLITNNIKGKIGDVVYNSKPNQNFEMLLDAWYKDYLNDNNNSKPVCIKDKIRCLSHICEFLSPFVKYKDYRYEYETRIIYDIRDGRDAYDVLDEQITQTLNDLCQIRDTSKQFTMQQQIITMCNLLNKGKQVKPLLPYVFKQIGIECLCGLIVGPCVNYDIMQPIIDRELKSSDIKIKIQKSKIPYR